MRGMERTPFFGLLLASLLALSQGGCAHPAERALQGRWHGESVENFERDNLAAATGWAKGTSFEFEGKHLKVTVPEEKPRHGVYSLTSIENRQLTLSVLNAQGEQTELNLIVDDAESLRWVLDEGRTLVMKRD